MLQRIFTGIESDIQIPSFIIIDIVIFTWNKYFCWVKRCHN